MRNLFDMRSVNCILFFIILVSVNIRPARTYVCCYLKYKLILADLVQIYSACYICISLCIIGEGKLEQCIKQWATWLKTTSERGEDETWEHDDMPERAAAGLARMVSVFLFLNTHQ